MLLQICVVLVSYNMAHKVVCSDTEAKCRTRWFNSNKVSTEGDSEMLSNLLKKFPGQICANPVGIEAQTITGIKAKQTGNTYHISTQGFKCLNTEQQKKPCEDYKVLFICTGTFCSGCLTPWFDDDDETGMGDYEVLSYLLMKYPKETCTHPLAIEAQTLSGVPAEQTGNIFQVHDATFGFACVKSEQKGTRCGDFKVRFTCPEESCSVSTDCKTGWLNSDSPVEDGDIETLMRLQMTFPGKVCTAPISIDVQTVAGVPAHLTGDIFQIYDNIYGFACINTQQEDQTCEDYKVKLTCPADFCQECRTKWFDRDDPNNKGDYETLAELHQEYPGEICSDPIGIEAVTILGIPAYQTENVFQVYDATNGFACVNAAQPNKTCADFKVRFTCPYLFCTAM
ncbi:uncharacterized protein si:dkey-205h13.2 [Erpetoichthys calabaricus]|uniref:uncharacterized protein si:dkey-205h13.2 n=1 Tax=Erpetoichthys calabaricus TaxID=27687 RepID=UPI002233EC50|nr:uncharacterized protein si:dkey-205h13.2 [Erpetoichthys calabaricus]